MMKARQSSRSSGWGSFLKLGAATIFPRAAVVRGPRSTAEVAMTFDDGPHPTQTPRLLEVLAKQEVRATFFLQGDHAARFPQWVREIHRAGHQIANHSYSHIRARQRAPGVFIAEIERTHALLEDLVGCRLMRDYRPPYGNITARTFATLAARGYRSVFWTVDSGDSEIMDREKLISHVSQLEIDAGDIVLFHEDYPHTVEAMPSIIAGLRASGLTPQRLDRLVPLVGAN